MSVSINSIYKDVLHYDISNRSFKAAMQRLLAKETVKSALRLVAKRNDLPLDSTWSKNRLEIFLRLKKKKAQLAYKGDSDAEVD